MTRKGKVQRAEGSTRVEATSDDATAVAPSSFPNDIVDKVVRELVIARRRLASAPDKKTRLRAEQHVRVLHAGVILLNQLSGDAAHLERAAKAAGKLLKALDVKDLYGGDDRRGHADAKVTLLDTMKRAVMGNTLTERELRAQDALQTGLQTALTRAGQGMRTEGESTARIPPTAGSPLSHKLAFDFHAYGLSDAAVVAMCGRIDEATVNDMARALRRYARELEQHKTPTLEVLCARALFAAGVLSVKERSEFFRLT